MKTNDLAKTQDLTAEDIPFPPGGFKCHIYNGEEKCPYNDPRRCQWEIEKMLFEDSKESTDLLWERYWRWYIKACRDLRFDKEGDGSGYSNPLYCPEVPDGTTLEDLFCAIAVVIAGDTFISLDCYLWENKLPE